MYNDTDHNPFVIPGKRFFARPLESLLGLRRLINIYASRPKGSNNDSFLNHTEKAFGINLSVEGFDLAKLPPEGPLLIVANHPLGGLEGVVLARLLREFRPDTKVMTNELLTRIPELSEVFIGVDVLGDHNEKRASSNLKGLREASRHLNGGGALLIFPAGKVATYDREERRIKDQPWNRVVGSLARKSKCTCLPIYVNAKNSKLFYGLAAIHPLLRTMMLPRELSNKSGSPLRLQVGEPILNSDLLHLKGADDITNYLRLSTELLRPERQRSKTYEGVKFKPLKPAGFDAIPQHLDKLADFKLLENERFDVFCVPFAELGPVMDVIGAAREVTFRAAGEGTGNEIDIDRFDPHYEHLFVWDREARTIVGGYRIGRVDDIVAKHGIDALYSRTLYRFTQSYLDKIGAPLEMGRSFVHPDYQRLPQALDLLWRGIGAYVAKNPRYHTLFGAVSISNEHSDLARAFMAEAMVESFRAEQQFLQGIEPVVPLKVSGKVWSSRELQSLSHVSLINKLVGRCDPGKALPTLLRHYLSLNGRFVCFSVNRVFNDSLDGLILVDLRKTPSKYLNRYLTKEGASRCLAVWSETGESMISEAEAVPTTVTSDVVDKTA